MGVGVWVRPGCIAAPRSARWPAAEFAVVAEGPHHTCFYPLPFSVLLPACLPGVACRYNEIAELVVAAGQRRALQERAQRQGMLAVPAEGAVLKVCGAVFQSRYIACIVIFQVLQFARQLTPLACPPRPA